MPRLKIATTYFPTNSPIIEIIAQITISLVAMAGCNKFLCDGAARTHPTLLAAIDRKLDVHTKHALSHVHFSYVAAAAAIAIAIDLDPTTRNFRQRISGATHKKRSVAVIRRSNLLMRHTEQLRFSKENIFTWRCPCRISPHSVVI